MRTSRELIDSRTKANYPFVLFAADDREDTAESVERLMGTKAEARFAFVQKHAEFASEDMLDV